MTRFRNLDQSRSATVQELGAAALDDLLDRGDFAAWTPIAREIASNPGGPVAETVLKLCDAHPMYGTSALWREWIARRRAQQTSAARPSLAEVRGKAGLTQQQMAERLGISQADVSKLERRGDVRLSTLHAYARALGATLRTTLQFPDSADPVEVDVSRGRRRLPPAP
jgi:DNA-binding XRE family transcriptional regulator